MHIFQGRRTAVAASVAAFLFSATPLAAQDISINLGQGAGAAGGLNERIVQLIALLTVLSLAPSILVMMTSFTRIVVVLSLLRTALGTATAPPNSVVISLALFLTAFVMGPVLNRAFEIGFLLFLPFLIIDLVVASVLMSMGMMMLPPVVVSLPFKLIFFVLVDGWHLVAGSLVQSYGGS